VGLKVQGVTGSQVVTWVLTACARGLSVRGSAAGRHTYPAGAGWSLQHRR